VCGEAGSVRGTLINVSGKIFRPEANVVSQPILAILIGSVPEKMLFSGEKNIRLTQNLKVL